MESSANTNTESSNRPSFLQTISDNVDRGIARGFRWWSRLVTRAPYAVIVFGTLFAVVWAFAFVKQFRKELDSDDLFTPKDARSFNDKAYVDEARILSISNSRKRSGDCESRLLLRDEEHARTNIQEFFRIYQEIEHAQVEYDGEIYQLNDICIKPANFAPCLLISILDLWNYDSDIILAEDFNPLERINEGNLTNRFGLPMEPSLSLGKNKGRDCEAEIEPSSNVEAFAMSLVYIYEREEVDGAEIDPQSQKWIEHIADRMRDISQDSILDTYVADGNAVGRESDRQIQKDVELLSFGYMLVILYTNVVLCKNSCLFNKAHLSAASAIGIGFALISAFGMGQTLGLKFNQVVQALPFLILGLGIDDTFIIVGAYQRVRYDLPVEEKIAQTLERAGSSIFVTSATDFCAFMLGLYTRLPALRVFSAYAAMAILLDFLYQVTFFVAFLVLESRREERFRDGCPHYGIAFRWNLKKNTDGNKPMVSPNPQEMLHSIEHPAEETPSQESTSMPETTSIETETEPMQQHKWPKMFGRGNFDPHQTSFATRIVSRYLSSMALHPIGRVIVPVIECILLIAAIYGCTKVRMNFNFIDMFTPEGSSLKTAFDLESRYFFGDQVFFSVYTKEANEDYFYHQDELEALKSALDDNPFVQSPVRTWYEDYSSWLRVDSPYIEQLIDGSPPDAQSFNQWLREYVNRVEGIIYRDSIVFNNDTLPRVISSKIDVISVDIVDGQQQVDLLDSIRGSIQSAAPSLDPITFALPFLFFDGFRVIAWETVRNVMLAALGVFVMNVVVLASISMAAIVVGVVALTDVMIFGYMYYVGQSFNPVTAINLVLAVGIAVDYSAHIAHSFLVLPGTKLDRARGALEHIGGEVIAGAFTTWLGVAVMGFAGHFVFRTFFQMFFGIVVFGVWHGLVLLPVILSYFGSGPYLSRT